MKIDPQDTLVVALDVGGLDDATALVERLGEQVQWYKIGLELYSAGGPDALTMLKERDKRVFVDLKLHDIPNTVARAAVQLALKGADIVDLHVAAGSDAMGHAAAAVREVCGEGPRPVLLGVTVLTSAAVDAAGQPLSPEALVEEAARRALMAQAAGLDGAVAPARAASEIRRQCGESFQLLVPGIRPAGSAKGDQRWVTTPAAAIHSGARWIVVGRPIHSAPDPAAAAAAILKEIADA